MALRILYMAWYPSYWSLRWETAKPEESTGRKDCLVERCALWVWNDTMVWKLEFDVVHWWLCLVWHVYIHMSDQVRCWTWKSGLEKELARFPANKHRNVLDLQMVRIWSQCLENSYSGGMMLKEFINNCMPIFHTSGQWDKVEFNQNEHLMKKELQLLTAQHSHGLESIYLRPCTEVLNFMIHTIKCSLFEFVAGFYMWRLSQWHIAQTEGRFSGKTGSYSREDVICSMHIVHKTFMETNSNCL